MSSLPVLVGVGRAAFGAVGYAAPDLARHGGLPGAAANADAKFMTRLFGARDIVLGVLTVLPATRRVALAGGVLVDALDTVSALAGERDGMTEQQRKLFAAVGIGAVVGGVIAMAADRRSA